MNLELASKIIDKIHSFGVTEFCICAGARNSPLVVTLVDRKDVRTFHFFEERSAAFFALGRARITGRPVVVVTTSGTAAAELLPAAVEAHYASIPLILLTADRPKSFRNSGAPQAIEQIGLYSHYIERYWDISDFHDLEGLGELESLDYWSRQRPIHINVCFDEPLLSHSKSEVMICENHRAFSDHSISASIQFLQSVRKPLIIVGTLETSWHEAVVRLLLFWSAPVYLESTSGIRNDLRLQAFRLQAGESFLNRIGFDSVIRIGGVPTARYWRDLDYDPLRSLPVLSLSSSHFSGLKAGRSHHVRWWTDSSLLSELRCTSFLEFTESVVFQDRLAFEQLNELLLEEPNSEPGFFRQLSLRLPADSILFLGNSLPIREWDLAAHYDEAVHCICANRGANGIDGQLSTFYGAHLPSKDHWAILGDLTTMYDLSAPWIVKQLSTIRTRLVIINNGGGMIFSRMFNRSELLNRHSIAFKSWAELWGLDYLSVTNSFSEWTNELDHCQHAVIEIFPDASSTERFWQRYGEIEYSWQASQKGEASLGIKF